MGWTALPPALQVESLQAFHDQSVDLLKELLRDSDVFLALRIDALLELDNFGIPYRHYLNCSVASPWIRGTSLM
jgi:hypothetical protein